jgi:small subunit ribosomal protein S1
VNLNVGDKVSGKVVVMADYGAFIEIAAGVEGLIHVSEMSWSQHLRSAQDFMKIGDTVEAVILTLDRDERKMSLGIKQLMTDPWSEIESKYGVDSKHTAKVRNFTNFGVFVELEEGVDGLIHISDLSWQKKIKHPSEFCKVGDMLDVIVMEIDRENRRISLGHKQLEENPWDVFEGTFAEGSTHSGTITEMKDKSGIVSLPYGVEGICPSKHLRKADGSNAKVEDTLDFVVIEFNKDAKKIVLSHTRTFDDTQEAPALAAKPAKGAKGKQAAGKQAKEPKAKQAKATKAAKAPKAKKAAAGAETADEISVELDGGKRSFKAMLPGSEKFEGRYTGLTPYQAANKALSKYYREANRSVETSGSEITFSIRESTRGSKRSVYTYNGRREKLNEPVKYTIMGKDKEGNEVERVVMKEFKNRLTKVKKAETTESATVSA